MNSENENKICQSCKQNFMIEPADFKFYEKVGVPPPTFCPECRLIRRLSFRNERYLYKRKCSLCEKEMISIFAPEKEYIVYCQPCWWSDRWDPLKYGREYDVSKPFFEQFFDFYKSTPLVTVFNDYTTLVNSDYVHMTSASKDCYLTTHADHNEDYYYSSGLKRSKDSMDCTMVQKSEFCYDSLNIMQGFQNFYSVDCENNHNIYFSKNLVGCNDCFGSVNLRHKSYCIFNKPYSKEEYKKKIKEFNAGSYQSVQAFKEKAHTFWTQFPQKYYHGSHNQNVSGDYIYASKNALASYEMVGAEDCRYCQFLSTKPSKDCYDYTEWGDGALFIYESLVSGIDINTIKFSWNIYTQCKNVEYSINCVNCEDVFASVSLRHKKYCIFNKQYSKEEYEKRVLRIKEHINTIPYIDKKGNVYKYGEFFPPEFSPFGYNETVLEFFPLDKKEVVEKGYNWYEPKKREWIKSIYEIPDHIEDVKDDILDSVLTCVTCSKNYRLIKAELQLYRRLEIPIPRKCYDCRHFERVAWRSPMVSSLRACGKCGKQIETNITHGISPIVYCEQCYLAEVV